MSAVVNPGVVLRPCAKQTCRELVERGRCAKHAPEADRERGSSTARGYDAVWQRFRTWFIGRHPLCVDCQEQNALTATTEVHHVKKLAEYPALRLVESNCLGLCAACHAIRTRRGE